jgi:hypothetical protein
LPALAGSPKVDLPKGCIASAIVFFAERYSGYKI